MARVLLLGPAREAAGVRHDEIAAATLGDLLAAAVARYGPAFGEVLAVSRVWVNGEDAEESRVLVDQDEVAVLPPVSGG